MVRFTKNPANPSETIFLTRRAERARQSNFSRRMALFPVRNLSTHTAEQPCAITVASAAPWTPISSTKMNTGSRTIFTTAPSPTVIMPISAKPCALIKGFMPRLTITKRVPQR